MNVWKPFYIFKNKNMYPKQNQKKSAASFIFVNKIAHIIYV